MKESTSRVNQPLSNRDNKENYFKSIPDSAITHLKEQAVSLKNEFVLREKQYQYQIELLQKQILEYQKQVWDMKNFIAIKTIIQTNHQHSESKESKEKLDREQTIWKAQLEEERQRLKERIKAFEQSTQIQKKQLQCLEFEKVKSMEISLIEKLQVEEKNQLLEQQILSKDKIVQHLQKQLTDSTQQMESSIKLQNQNQLKQQELNTFEQLIQEKNLLQIKKMQNQIDCLQTENQFLKQQIKKSQKNHHLCHCDLNEDQIKENLYEIQRELIFNKVELQRKVFLEERKAKSNYYFGESQSQSDDFKNARGRERSKEKKKK